jgi:antitoxin VapB
LDAGLCPEVHLRAESRRPATGVADVDNPIYIVVVCIYMGAQVPINVNNSEADALTRKFAQLEGVGITEAIVIAMREAIERRRGAETPRQTAARLRAKHGVTLGEASRSPLPKGAFDALWDGP